jgi:hypothetical protein
MEPIVIWDLDDDPDGNVIHIAEHGVTREEVEEILQNEDNETDASVSSGRPITFGWTSTGKHLAVVWEDAGDDPRMVYPITAYETPPRAG